MSTIQSAIQTAIPSDMQTPLRPVPIGTEAQVRAALQQGSPRLPAEMADEQAKRQRLDFLRNSLPDADLAGGALERVLAGNELQAANYLARGAIACRAVARIAIRDSSGRTAGWGTGFLIAPGVLITNNHVLPDASYAVRSEAQFGYEVDLRDADVGPVRFRLTPQRLFHTSQPLDFSVVAVEDRPIEGNGALSRYGFLPLLDVPGKAFEGEWLTIVQHPNGERKQLCVRENKLLKRADDVLWYSTDTQPGSSGSPVFNNDWFVVALHHSGVPAEQDSPFAPTKWIANEGIRASRITQTLKQAQPRHPLLQPLFSATPASARIRGEGAFNTDQRIRETPIMSTPAACTLPAEIILELRPDGSYGPRAIAAAHAGLGEAYAAALVEAKKPKKPAPDAPFDHDYSKRKGYDPDLLGTAALRVELPTLSPGMMSSVLEFGNGHKQHVLRYHNFSVVMHKERKLAIYSAANVRFDQRFEMSRPEDVWREDPRIPQDAQIRNSYYASNAFDRGHLTRREDLEYGKSAKAALQSAADTCHWTNCTPQHAQFNQNKEIWQGIERHLLEDAIVDDNFHAQVFTGPVLTADDPVYRKLQYPLQYWKVVAVRRRNERNQDELFATAFLASQEEVIRQFGIEVTEMPIGPFRTFQLKIAEIERLTGLTFGCGADARDALRNHDPLATPKRKPRRAPRVQESTVTGAASHYFEIADFDDIVT